MCKKGRWIPMFMVIAAMLPQLASAQTDQDWRDTVAFIKKLSSSEYPGCPSLKWINLDRDCTNASIEVDKKCKDGSITKAEPLQSKAEGMVSGRANIKRAIADFESRINSESDPAKKKDLLEKKQDPEARLKIRDTELQNVKTDLEKLRTAALGCVKARQDIARIFKAAVAKANALSSHSPVKKDVEDFVEKRWDKSDKDHMDERLNIWNIHNRCEDALETIRRGMT